MTEELSKEQINYWGDRASKFLASLSDGMLEEYSNARTVGICLHCYEDSDYVEPDAECYLCETCGEKAVFGFAQIVILGVP